MVIENLDSQTINNIDVEDLSLGESRRPLPLL